MARRRQREIPPCSKTYGFPIFCASWVPLDRISTSAAASAEATTEGDAPAEGEEKEGQEKEGQGGGGGPATLAQTPDPNRILVALGGGGGDSRSGVPNVLLVAEFDFASRSLSETPVNPSLAPFGFIFMRRFIWFSCERSFCGFSKSSIHGVCRYADWELIRMRLIGWPCILKETV